MANFSYPAMVAASLMALAVSTRANADQIQNNQQVHNALSACMDNQFKFSASVARVGEQVQKQSNEYSPKSGTLTLNSTRVWDRDIRMIMHYFSVEFNSVSHKAETTVGQCNNIINFYSRCVDELYENVTATTSVQRPTTGCLGRLYDTYHLTDDDYYHGR